MKFYAYECLRFHNPRPIFTLIGMLFLALEARAGEENCNSSSTFLAVNTSNGAQLVYQNSDSGSINKITFEGLYLSSAMACGMNYRRCPNLTVLMDGNVLVVVIPLQEHFGLVTYAKNDNYFTFREKYAIDISSLNLNCEISSISQYFPSKLTVIGRCLHTKTPPKLLNSVYVAINSSSLSESDYFTEQFCSINSPSEFVFFVSRTFPMGVTVFIDNGQVKFQRNGEDCEPFGEISVCTDVQRFTSVSPNLQAIYCETTTYLLDIVSLPAVQTFQRGGVGIPFFCTNHTYYAYKDGKISFHLTTDRIIAVPSGFLFYRDDVVWGDCVSSRFVVMQSAEGKVFSLRVETKQITFIGYSQTIPRIFGTTVLLNNMTHALLYDLQTSKLDFIEQEFVMGYVIRNDDRCNTIANEERKITLLDILLTSSFGWLMIILMMPVLLMAAVYTTRNSRKMALGSREKGTAPKLDQADTNMIHQIPANGSGPPHCVTVDNSPELDSVTHPRIG